MYGNSKQFVNNLPLIFPLSREVGGDLNFTTQMGLLYTFNKNTKPKEKRIYNQ